MDIYTYGSNRGSCYGYQYSCFSLDRPEKKIVTSKCARSDFFKASEKLLDSFEASKEFAKWCENRNGWQLVLKKMENDQYLLMAGQLEKSRELKKKINESTAYFYFDKSKQNDQDSGLYINLGFCGEASEIKLIAASLVRQLHKDGFYGLFNKIEKTIRKSEDASRYEINVNGFQQILNEMINAEKTDVVQHTSAKKFFLTKIFSKNKKTPDIYLASDIVKSRSVHKKEKAENIEKCVNLLKTEIKNFSERLLLVAAYDYFEIDERVNIRIDYEYLWYFRN